MSDNCYWYLNNASTEKLQSKTSLKVKFNYFPSRIKCIKQN